MFLIGKETLRVLMNFVTLFQSSDTLIEGRSKNKASEAFESLIFSAHVLCCPLALTKSYQGCEACFASGVSHVEATTNQGPCFTLSTNQKLLGFVTCMDPSPLLWAIFYKHNVVTLLLLEYFYGQNNNHGLKVVSLT